MNDLSENIRCVVVDDEPLAIKVLIGYIQKTPFLELMGTYHDSISAVAAVKSHAVDLVFLDIHMPDISGLEVASFLGTKCKVIFVTASPHHALDGFELNAVDYLLKPVSFERFLKAINKVLDSVQAATMQTHNDKAPTISLADQVLFVKADHQIVKVFLSNILFVEGLREYIAIHTFDKKLVCLQSLKKMEEVLPSSHFIRVHKSYIVAADKIDFVTKNKIFIKDSGIPLGETYRKAFFHFLECNNLL